MPKHQCFMAKVLQEERIFTRHTACNMHHKNVILDLLTTELHGTARTTRRREHVPPSHRFLALLLDRSGEDLGSGRGSRSN